MVVQDLENKLRIGSSKNLQKDLEKKGKVFASKDLARRPGRWPADPRAPCGATTAGHRFFKTFVQFCLRFGRLPFTLRVFARSCAPMFSPCSHPVVAYFGGLLKYLLMER